MERTEADRLRAELERLSRQLDMSHVTDAGREQVATTLVELVGYAREQWSLARRKEPVMAGHWMATGHWLEEVLGALPGQHMASWSSAEAGTSWRCWCPLGEDHRVETLPERLGHPL